MVMENMKRATVHLYSPEIMRIRQDLVHLNKNLTGKASRKLLFYNDDKGEIIQAGNVTPVEICIT